MKICKNCGYRRDDPTAKFCPMCGGQMVDEPVKQPKKKKSPYMLILICLCALIVVGLVVIVILLSTSGKDKGQESVPEVAAKERADAGGEDITEADAETDEEALEVYFTEMICDEMPVIQPTELVYMPGSGKEDPGLDEGILSATILDMDSDAHSELHVIKLVRYDEKTPMGERPLDHYVWEVYELLDGQVQLTASRIIDYQENADRLVDVGFIRCDQGYVLSMNSTFAFEGNVGWHKAYRYTKYQIECAYICRCVSTSYSSEQYIDEYDAMADEIEKYQFLDLSELGPYEDVIKETYTLGSVDEMCRKLNEFGESCQIHYGIDQDFSGGALTPDISDADEDLFTVTRDYDQVEDVFKTTFNRYAEVPGSEDQPTVSEETQAADISSVYELYADVLAAAEAKHGKAGTARVFENFEYLTGVFYAELIDFDRDGTEELIFGYIEGVSDQMMARGIEIWGIQGNQAIQLYAGDAYSCTDEITSEINLVEMDGQIYLTKILFGGGELFEFIGVHDHQAGTVHTYKHEYSNGEKRTYDGKEVGADFDVTEKFEGSAHYDCEVSVIETWGTEDTDPRNVLKRTRKLLNMDTTDENTASKENVESKSLDYYHLYGSIIKGTQNAWGYVLRDVDMDGVTELFLQIGTCEADSTFEVYTIDKDKAAYLGSLAAGHSVLALDDGDTSLYLYWAHMGYEGKSKITLSGGKLIEEVLYNDKPCPDGYDDSGRTYLPYNAIDDLEVLRSLP